jgi:hypothetical protein
VVLADMSAGSQASDSGRPSLPLWGRCVGHSVQTLADRQLDHVTLVGVGWARVALFGCFLGILLGLRSMVPNWGPVLGPNLGFGAYAVVVLLLLGRRRDRFALAFGGALDIASQSVAVSLLAVGTDGRDLGVPLMVLLLAVVLPLGVIHFGALAGTVVNLLHVTWYLLASTVVAGAPAGIWAHTLYAVAGISVAIMLAWVVFNLQREHERRLRDESRLNESRREALLTLRDLRETQARLVSS